MKTVACVLFILVLVGDLFTVMDNRKTKPSEIFLRAGMVLAFPFLLRWF